MELAVCLAIFGLVVFALAALLESLSKHDLYLKRLQSLQDSNANSRPARLSWRVSWNAFMQKMSRLFATRSYTENIQAQLINAGIPLKGEEYLTLCLALIILFPLILFLLSGNVWLTVIAVVGGVFSPRVYVNHKKDKRLQALNHQLGDALVVMANALRAGFGFQQAMDTVRRELPPPIATEFAWTLREMNLGVSHEEALQNLGKRVRSEDLEMVITGIIIQRQVGGNLAEILDNISDTIRERIRIKREVKTLTAQGRLSGLIIGLLPLVLIAFMLVVNPDYFTVMIKDMRGIAALVTASVMEVLGIIIINKIIDIEV